MMLRYLGIATSLTLASADVYMHLPRGSNNRLNEKSANRKNGNRLFDSQNNNRGGYNVGDLKEEPFNQDENNVPGALFNKELNKDQYSFTYFEGSIVNIEWTNQHGCGGNEDNDPHKTNCNIVIQYTCNTNDAKVTDPAMKVELKDGRNTNTPDEPNAVENIQSTKNNNDDAKRGRHESEGFYYECKNRARNNGLFHADQKLKGTTQKYTRQNPNGNRRGLECPEERDYYPYWNPSPWVDIAYLTDNVADCKANLNVEGNSQNQKAVYKCVTTSSDNNAKKEAYAALTKEECEKVQNAEWKEFKKDFPRPTCEQAQWSRVNHLGNADTTGHPNMFNWTIPTNFLKVLENNDFQVKSDVAKCVLRLRYNISTDDYDPRNTNSSLDGKKSPIYNNPTVSVNADMQGLKLALNTAQTGRTFQDRSHAFYVKKRESQYTGKIHNLNIRGKRGNIVQTFPAVEYDFVPQRLEVNPGDWIHFQWTGSNTHNNGNPAGDGQAGDAGEGKGGTDRSNIVGAYDPSANFPIPVDTKDELAQNRHLLLTGLDCYRHEFNADGAYYNFGSPKLLSPQDAAVYFASSGYYKSKTEFESKATQMDPLLNNASPSLISGLMCKVKGSTSRNVYHYFSTRNNNFSNRSQKGVIVVK